VVAWLVVLRTWSRRVAATRAAQGARAVAGPGAAPGLRVVGLFVLFPVVILLFLAGTVLYARAAPVVPALRSYWLVVHVTTITVSSGLLIVPGVASLLFLLRGAEGADRSPEHAGSGLRTFVERLPGAAALDRLAYRTTIVAFPLYTFGVIAGAIWAEAAWAGSGAGTRRRPSRSSPGSSTPPTCTHGPPRGGAAAGPRGSTSSASPSCCSTCSSSTWSSQACTPTQVCRSTPAASTHSAQAAPSGPSTQRDDTTTVG